MNKQEAMHIMIDGKTITHDAYDKGEHCYFDIDNSSFVYESFDGHLIKMIRPLEHEYGYKIFKKEKNLKGVLNIYPEMLPKFYPDKETAKKSRAHSCIACVPIEIKYYEEEGL